MEITVKIIIIIVKTIGSTAMRKGDTGAVVKKDKKKNRQNRSNKFVSNCLDMQTLRPVLGLISQHMGEIYEFLQDFEHFLASC